MMQTDSCHYAEYNLLIWFNLPVTLSSKFSTSTVLLGVAFEATGLTAETTRENDNIFTLTRLEQIFEKAISRFRLPIKVALRFSLLSLHATSFEALPFFFFPLLPGVVLWKLNCRICCSNPLISRGRERSLRPGLVSSKTTKYQI